MVFAKKLSFFITALFTVFSISSQEISISQPVFNPLVINPATAGNLGGLELVGFHRSQWLGIKGAPVSYIFSGNSILSEYRENVGVGFSLRYEQILPINNIEVKLQYAYKIPINRDHSLTLGLDFGVEYESLDLNDFDIVDEDDSVINGINNDKKIIPLLGLGAFYSTSKLYVGISALNLLAKETIQETLDALEEDKFIFNAYLISGYEFEITRDISLKTAVNISLINVDQVLTDITVNGILYENFILGATYRHNASVGGNTGFYLNNKKVLIGLQYQTSVGNTFNRDLPSNNGTFELFAKINFLKRNRYERFKTPRFL